MLQYSFFLPQFDEAEAQIDMIYGTRGDRMHKQYIKSVAADHLRPKNSLKLLQKRAEREAKIGKFDSKLSFDPIKERR